jgi:Tfp pilus assembly protein PilV
MMAMGPTNHDFIESGDDVRDSHRGWRERRSLFRAISGMTLIEAMVAVGIIGIALVGLISGIGYMRMENRAASQRLLVASIGTEILELFKALPYASIANSTATTPIYLKGFGTTSPDAAWLVPQAGQTQPLPVEDVNSSSASYPSLVANKIPQGVWSVSFVPDATTPGVQQINVTIQWKLYAGTTRPPNTYTISTKVCTDFPNL